MFGWISAPLIYLVSALGAATLAFDNPARSALIPNLVPRRHLPNALSLNIIVWQIATIIGPTVAGIFIAFHDVGELGCFVIDRLNGEGLVVYLNLIGGRVRSGAHLGDDLAIDAHAAL